ncbi:MAG: capsular biosynthesis protein, partial [Plesiomonas shigelloides]
MNTATYMQGYLFTTLVVCGLAQYFTGVSAFLWLPCLLALGMVLLLPLQTRYSPLHLDHSTTLLLALFAGFFLLALLTTLLQNGVAVTIVGMKNELALSLIFPALLLGFCRESQIYRITRCFYWVFYLQIPVVLYQILVVVPHRVAVKGEFEKWDSV